MEQGVPECCRNKLHHRPPPPPPPSDPCAGGRAPPSRAYSPPYAQPYAQPYAPRSNPTPAPTRPPAPCAQSPRPPVSPPAYRSYPRPVTGSPTGPRVASPRTQLAPMQFSSNMLVEPTESCVIIEEEIERVEPVDFPENMQNVKKEVKLVRPYGVVIQSIEEVIEELPRGAARPSVQQRSRRKITRRGSGAGGAGGVGRRLPGAPWDRESSPRDACDSANAADPNAPWCGAQY